MKFKISLLMLTCVFAVAQVFANASVDEADVKGTKKCLNVRNLNVCNLATINTLAVTGNETVGGTLAVSGNESVGGALIVSGNETVGGNLAVSGNEAVSGSFEVSGDAVVGGTLNVAGLITAAVGLTATTENIVATTGNLEAIAGNVTFNPNELTSALNALGSLETIGARMVWATLDAATPSFTVNSGFNSSITHSATGIYTLGFATHFSNNPVIIVTPASATVAGYMVDVSAPSTSGCTVNVFDHTGAAINAGFNIVVIGV